MRSLDVIRQKRRFEMFNAKSKDKVLELNSFFGKYIMHFEERIKKVFTYYDTPNFDLQKSGISLYKTQIGNFVELNMATEKVNTGNVNYTLRTNYKHFAIKIKAGDSLFKHKDFLIDSFTSMFMSGINFDPEFLLKKLRPAYTISTVSTEYRSMNVTGLKITYSFDNDIYTNHFTNQTAKSDILTIYQHSGIKTDEAFEDLIGKLIRYCKELTPTKETKIMIARRITIPKAEPIKLTPKELEKMKKKKK